MALGGLLSALGVAASAVDLSWQPQVRLGTRASDNVRWSATESEAALGFDTSGAVALKAAAENWQSTINPSFNIRRFPIGEDLGADEYGVRSNHQWKWSDSLATSLTADYQRDSTLTTETIDAGLQNDVANRDTVVLNPSVSYLLSDATSINSSYLYTDISFSADASSGLVDYNYQQASVGASHLWNARLMLYGNGTVSLFDVASASSSTWTYTGQVGLRFQYSSDLKVDLAAGYAQSTINFIEPTIIAVGGPIPHLVQVFPSQTTSTGGPVASVSVEKILSDDTRAKFDFFRRVSPTIRGTQSTEDDIALALEHNFSKLWWIGFRGGYNMRSALSEDAGGNVADLNRDQMSLSGVLGWRMNSQIMLKTEYRFARAELAETNESVYVNALFLTLTYDGDPHFFRGL